MNYDVNVVDEFKRDTKKLFKKYKSIKDDILALIEKLEEDYRIGIHLGNSLYNLPRCLDSADEGINLRVRDEGFTSVSYLFDQ